MIDAGVTVIGSLDLLRDKRKIANWRHNQQILKMYKGMSLSEAMKVHRDDFPNCHKHDRSGEVSGSLDTVLDRYRYILRRTIKSGRR